MDVRRLNLAVFHFLLMHLISMEGHQVGTLMEAISTNQHVLCPKKVSPWWKNNMYSVREVESRDSKKKYYFQHRRTVRLTFSLIFMARCLGALKRRYKSVCEWESFLGDGWKLTLAYTLEMHKVLRVFSTLFARVCCQINGAQLNFPCRCYFKLL